MDGYADVMWRGEGRGGKEGRVDGGRVCSV